MDLDLLRAEAKGFGNKIAAAAEILRSVPYLDPVPRRIEARNRVQRFKLRMISVVATVFGLVHFSSAGERGIHIALPIENGHGRFRVCMDCCIAFQCFFRIEAIDPVRAPVDAERAPRSQGLWKALGNDADTASQLHRRDNAGHRPDDRVIPALR